MALFQKPHLRDEKWTLVSVLSVLAAVQPWQHTFQSVVRLQLETKQTQKRKETLEQDLWGCYGDTVGTELARAHRRMISHGCVYSYDHISSNMSKCWGIRSRQLRKQWLINHTWLFLWWCTDINISTCSHCAKIKAKYEGYSAAILHWWSRVYDLRWRSCGGGLQYIVNSTEYGSPPPEGDTLALY